MLAWVLLNVWNATVFPREKKNLCEKTKLQTAIVIICLWIWDLLACPVLYCDWSLHNHHSWTITDVHGFLSLMVNRPFAWWCVFTTKTRVHFVFSFLFNFVIPVRFKINIKGPHLHKKEKPWRIMAVEVKWGHHANDLLYLALKINLFLSVCWCLKNSCGLRGTQKSLQHCLKVNLG